MYVMTIDRYGHSEQIDELTTEALQRIARTQENEANQRITLDLLIRIFSQFVYDKRSQQFVLNEEKLRAMCDDPLINSAVKEVQKLWIKPFNYNDRTK